MKLEFQLEEVVGFMRLLKNLEMQMTTYHLFFEFVCNSEKIPPAEVMDALAKAKASAQQEADAKFDEALRKLEGTSDQDSLDLALREFLAKWPPKNLLD